MTDSAPNANPEQRALTRARLMAVAVVVPIVIALASSLVIISWIPSLPAEVAIHWNSGGVDGVGSPWQLVAILLGTIGLFSGVMAFSFSALPANGRPTLTQKGLAVTSLWLALLLGVGIAGSVAAQRGLSDVTQAPDPLPWLLLGMALGLLAAAAAWFVLPRADRTPPYALDVEPLELAPTERAFWTGTVTASRTLMLFLLGVVVVLVVSAVVSALSGAVDVVVILLLVVLVLGLALTAFRWRVSVGSHGASAVSVAGWPAIRIPLADISAARLIEVNPVGDFGGWGWRLAGGRTGIVLQAGPALEVARRNGRALVVPIDDAETAAAVLQAALAQRDE